MQETMDLGLQLARVAGSLLLVVAVLLGALYGVKRWGHWMKQSNKNEWIQILAQHSFGPKHHLLVVRVQDEKFLVGVSPQGMHALSSLSAKVGGSLPQDEAQ